MNEYIKKINNKLYKLFNFTANQGQKKSKNKLPNLPFYVKNLKGKKALEIGGPTDIFKDNYFFSIYSCLRSVDGCNFSNQTTWEGDIKEGKNYEFISGRKGYQYILDATALSSIKSEKYDVILSSHNIEHIANPIKALKEWLRVLKLNGYLLLVVPHKEGTFDCQRPVTSLTHIIEDYETNIGEEDLTHLEETLKLHDLSKDAGVTDFESLRERAINNFHNRCLHHHVFDTYLVLSLLNHVGLNIEKVDYRLPYHIIVLAQKSERLPENIPIVDYLRSSPFEIDQLKYQEIAQQRNCR